MSVKLMRTRTVIPRIESLMRGIMFKAWLFSWLILGFLPLAGAALPVEDFVRADFFHGLPISAARNYDRTNAPKLIQMLNDPMEKGCWPNIVTTLGVIGDESVISPLVDFLEHRFEGEVDLKTFNALLNVSAALGHAAYRGNTNALNYLKNNHTVSAWKSKALGWTFKRYEGDKLSILLCKIHVRGIAISGKQEAKDLLLKMNTDQGAEYVELRTYAAANIAEALSFYDLLIAVGPDEAFKHRQPGGNQP